MASVLVAASELLLVGVFLVAGITKLIDLASFRQSLGEFGVPSTWIRGTGVLVPAFELFVAGVLLLPPTALVGAAFAVLMLVLFSGVVVFQLTKGKTPHCYCFGQLDDQPIGSATLVRNGVLLIVAGLALWQEAVYGPIGGFGWLSEFSGFQRVAVAVAAALFIIVAVEGWILLFVLRQLGKLLTSLSSNSQADMQDDGLPVGDIAPEFELPSTAQTVESLTTLRAGGNPLLLVFSSEGCSFCEELLPDLGQWDRDHSKGFEVVLITSNDREHADRIASEHGIRHVLLQDGRTTGQTYGARHVPAAVFVSPEGRVASDLALGPPDIRTLVESKAAEYQRSGDYWHGEPVLAPSLSHAEANQ
jgi:methylamine dehydrogenase accessory protein MauD